MHITNMSLICTFFHANGRCEWESCYFINLIVCVLSCFILFWFIAFLYQSMHAALRPKAARRWDTNITDQQINIKTWKSILWGILILCGSIAFCVLADACLPYTFDIFTASAVTTDPTPKRAAYLGVHSHQVSTHSLKVNDVSTYQVWI